MKAFVFPVLMLLAGMSAHPADGPAGHSFPLDSVSGLELINVKADAVEHDGKEGIRVLKAGGEISGETLVLIQGLSFRDGTITLELTGEPAAGADPQMRGFVGVAFRVDPSDHSRYECFYLRPTNARSGDMLRRNHSTQYVSHPEYPWYRLRQESPGMYETYADLVPGEWTKMKITVKGATAKLFLHGSAQPSLVVNDLKHGESEGMIALWLHSSTMARFRDLHVTSANDETEDTSKGEPMTNQAEQDRRIDYIEFQTTDIEGSKKFYGDVFGWEFTDYGPDYSSFTDGRLSGGFVLADKVTTGNPLVVLYSLRLEAVRDLVLENGGKVLKDIFEFPGGRRFHFSDPVGNELAVWSDN